LITKQSSYWSIASSEALQRSSTATVVRRGRGDVAPVVTDVKRPFRPAAEQLAGVQDGHGRRFRLGRRIAADDAACARGELQQLDEWIGEAHPLVGDDTPAQIQGLQSIEQFGNAVEQPGGITQTPGVNFEKSVRKALVTRVRVIDIEACFEQSANALRGIRPEHG
jgi:hypothetical protein